MQFEHAINEYSLALKIVQSGQEETRLLCNRSAAFARCVCWKRLELVIMHVGAARTHDS